MTTDGAPSARKKIKLTATKQAVLLDVAKDSDFANDMGDDHDHDADADNDTLVTLDLLDKKNETDSPIVQSSRFSFTDSDQIYYQPGTWKSFHNIVIALLSVTMGNIIEELLATSNDNETF